MKTRLFLALGAMVLLYACSNEESKESLKMKADQENSLAILQAKALENLKQKFVFDSGQEYVELVTKSGVRIEIFPQELTVNGQPVNGAVMVEFIEIFSRGDMATANKTTSGVPNEIENPEEQVPNPLISGGEFFINMTTEEGQNIDEGAEFRVAVPTELTGGDDEDMTVWTGEEDWDDDQDGGDGDGDVKWDENKEDDGSDEEAPINGGEYILTLDRFGWVNIDKLREYPGPKTTIYVDVPNGFDDHNSKVYIAFEGQQNILIQLNTYDPVTGYFGENYNLMPVGETCHIIFVSGSGGNWLYAVKTITITPNGVETITSSDITTATQAAVISMLNSLP